MDGFSRRAMMIGVGASLMTAACGNEISGQGTAVIDARVSETLLYMNENYPGTRDLRDKAAGILVMPLITKAGFGLGGSFGRGALQIEDVTVDYYSAASASFGLQIGAKQFAHVLFFMNAEALSAFRQGEGWSAGGDIEYAISDQATNLSADTIDSLSPVIALIFGQAGAHVGASLEGTKYTRIMF